MTDASDEFDEHNRTMSEALNEINGNRDTEDIDVSYNYTSTIEREKDNAITKDEFKKIENVIEQIGTDEFDTVFAIENVPKAEVEQKIVNELEEEIIEGFVVQRTDEEIKAEEEENKFVIDGIEIIRTTVTTGVQISQTTTNENTQHIREYYNKPKFYKPVFGKAKTGEDNSKIYIFMAIMAVAVGIFGGVEANSYYIAVKGEVPNILSCSWSWLSMFDTLQVTVTPFYANVFFTSFFVWVSILGLFFLFSSMNTAKMKKSRVGHEHGNMRLSTKNDFRKYINKFMD